MVVESFDVASAPQGCRPFSAENEHTGSFSGRSEPQDDTLGAAVFRVTFGETFAAELTFTPSLCQLW